MTMTSLNPVDLSEYGVPGDGAVAVVLPQPLLLAVQVPQTLGQALGGGEATGRQGPWSLKVLGCSPSRV